MKGNSLLRLGAGGGVTLPVMDGSSWPPVPLVHFHLCTSPPPKTGKVTSEWAWLGSGPYAGRCWAPRFTRTFPTPPPPRSKKTAHAAPALPEFLPLRGCLPACPPMTSTWVFCSQYISHQSREPGKVRGCPGPPGGRPTSWLRASLAPLLPTANRAGASQGVKCGGCGDSSTY